MTARDPPGRGIHDARDPNPPAGDRVNTERLQGGGIDGAAGLARAAALLREGGIVAFPTETVYGLGANAFDRAALAKIFRAKQRPAWDPLILHVDGREMLDRVAVRSGGLGARADALIDAFWPGPLTLLLPRTAQVPDAVTARRPLVGVRMPAHPLALKLIRLARVPLAAPSANRFGHTSPTTAAHVLADLDGRIDAVLDGGATSVGVESTVLDVQNMLIYRPGAVTASMISQVTGGEVRVFAARDSVVSGGSGALGDSSASGNSGASGDSGALGGGGEWQGSGASGGSGAFGGGGEWQGSGASGGSGAFGGGGEWLGSGASGGSGALGGGGEWLRSRASRGAPEGLASPGIALRHYAPRARLVLVRGLSRSDPPPHTGLVDAIAALAGTGATTGVMLPDGWDPGAAECIFRWGPWEDAHGLARLLFAGLRMLDDRGVQAIVCPMPVSDGLGDALRDRLEKAAQTE